MVLFDARGCIIAPNPRPDSPLKVALLLISWAASRGVPRVVPARGGNYASGKPGPRNELFSLVPSAEFLNISAFRISSLSLRSRFREP